jgi:DNA-binding XRE family transcriptional regulator
MSDHANDDWLDSGQLRAARAILQWSQAKAADRAEIAPLTLASCEKDEKVPYASTLQRLRKVFQEQGIEFFETPSGKLAVAYDPKIYGVNRVR